MDASTERQCLRREFDMLANQFKFQLKQAQVIAVRMGKLNERMHELKKEL